MRRRRRARGSPELDLASSPALRTPFEKLRSRYKSGLEWSLHHRALSLIFFAIFVCGSSVLTLAIGRDFFPYVDSGQMRLHVLPPPGTRIEQSEMIFAAMEAEIRNILPKDRIDMILDNIGLPNGGINLAFGNNASISNSDGDILISLKPGKRQTQEFTRELRQRLSAQVPGGNFLFHASQHDKSDSGFRFACADRSSGSRQKSCSELPDRSGVAEEGAGHSGGG